jgi:ABC-2 type transport system permease protein
MNRVNNFVSGVGVVLSLELRQRVRGTGWYVLLGIFLVLVAIVTVIVSISLPGFTGDESNGGAVFSAIIYFVLLLGTLVTPAFSGSAINGDRDAGTLATTQVTLVSTGEIVIGKFLAAWVTALAFLVVAVPFLIYSALFGTADSVGTILVSVLVLALELGVVAAIGVGLSGLIARPLFSLVVTYLVVAALSVGTLIAFGLGGLAVQTTLTTTPRYLNYDSAGAPAECVQGDEYTYTAGRFDLFWGVLVANPYVLLADAVPTAYNAQGDATDLFGNIKTSIRQAQIPPDDAQNNQCTVDGEEISYPRSRDIIESTTPGWAVGMLIQLVLAAAALFGAWHSTRTPAKRLAKGSRIA